MNKVFLTKDQVEVRKGYLSSNKSADMSPIGHADFIAAQEKAEYVITFAEMAKGKDFTGKDPINLEEFRKSVANKLAKKSKEYVAAPKAPVLDITEKLKAEALSKVNFDLESEKTIAINKFMAEFDVITEFEEVGLFFDQQIVKINKIYTIAEITKAVKSVIDLL